ncbi:MAG: hypothetical protein J6V25_08275 [Oscillospiraceae bacterium]|nr:hypothetical protein [Oscillospiraceae bacterium]
MKQRINAGYIITQSIQVKDSEFVLGQHSKSGMYVTWLCKHNDNYYWAHYSDNYYDALKDLCQRVTQEIDYLASISAIPPLSFRRERDHDCGR